LACTLPCVVPSLDVFFYFCSWRILLCHLWLPFTAENTPEHGSDLCAVLWPVHIRSVHPYACRMLESR
jgi:hypothetical protein